MRGEAAAANGGGSKSSVIDELDEFDNDDDDDDDKEKEPIAKRQLNAVRDSFKTIFGSSSKYVTNTRAIKALNALLSPKNGGKVTAANVVNNLVSVLRTQLSKQSKVASATFAKQWQGLSKRIAAGRLALGNLGAKLTNREESATKNTKADEVVPTSLPDDKKVQPVKAAKTGSQPPVNQFAHYPHLPHMMPHHPMIPHPHHHPFGVYGVVGGPMPPVAGPALQPIAHPHHHQQPPAQPIHEHQPLHPHQPAPQMHQSSQGEVIGYQFVPSAFSPPPSIYHNPAEQTPWTPI